MNMDNIEHFEWDIDAEGIRVEAHGFKGKKCVQESDPILNAIRYGDEQAEVKRKVSYYQKAKGKLNQMLGGR